MSTAINEIKSRMYSQRELAGVLGMHVDTIRKATAQNRIPFVQQGTRKKFTPEMVKQICSNGFTWKPENKG